MRASKLQRGAERALIAGSLAAFIVFAFIPIAAAHWRAVFVGASPQVRKWYKAQRNGEGQSCCGHGDAHAFYGAYTFDRDGGISFDADGHHYHLQSYMVLNGPNPTGHAVWWYEAGKSPFGVWHYDFCFAPGAVS